MEGEEERNISSSEEEDSSNSSNSSVNSDASAASVASAASETSPMQQQRSELELEVHWDLSEDKVLLKYPDGYDQHSKPRFTLSYTKPEEGFERIKALNQSETEAERKPFPIILSGGCGQKKQLFLEFVAQFGNQVRSFTYISALHFPMEVIDLVRVLNSMQNLEEIDLRQLSLLQSKITDEEEFLRGIEIEEGKKLGNVKRIILGEQAELTEFLVELIFRMMPNVESVFDFPIHFLIQRPGFLGKERRGMIESVSWSERFFGFNEEGLVKDLNLLMEDSPRLRKGSSSPEVNVDGVEGEVLKKLEDFNVNLFQRVSTFKGIYQIFGI